MGTHKPTLAEMLEKVKPKRAIRMVCSRCDKELPEGEKACAKCQGTHFWVVPVVEKKVKTPEGDIRQPFARDPRQKGPI